MDFQLDDDQRAILDAVGQLLDQRGGAERAIALNAKAAYDSELHAALDEAGYLNVARGPDTGPLEAALVAEAVSHAAGVVAVGAGALVAPGVSAEEFPGPVALADADQLGPIRYACHARTLLLVAANEARAIPLEPGESTPVASNFGYPMGRVPADVASRGQSLGPGSGARMRSWWRVALAVEAVGCMAAALECTATYLKERRQFGHAIGSFQGVQHRLANLVVAVEGSRWLAYEAAYHRAPGEAAATAAAHALAAAGSVFVDTHQLSGAIGFTREHDLHVWSMRLQALRLELRGVSGHRRAVTEERWGGDA